MTEAKTEYRYYKDKRTGKSCDIWRKITIKGNVKEEQFFNGKELMERRRTTIDHGNGCTQVILISNEGFKEESWKQDGKLHRDNDLPALIFEDPQSLHKVLRWFCEGLPHRDKDDLPAEILYDENGKKKEECWFLFGEPKRRSDLPTVVNYD